MDVNFTLYCMAVYVLYTVRVQYIGGSLMHSDILYRGKFPYISECTSKHPI